MKNLKQLWNKKYKYSLKTIIHWKKILLFLHPISDFFHKPNNYSHVTNKTNLKSPFVNFYIKINSAF